jgi:hypothetical protein
MLIKKKGHKPRFVSCYLMYVWYVRHVEKSLRRLEWAISRDYGSHPPDLSAGRIRLVRVRWTEYFDIEMDAPDDKLHRASGDLIKELKAKLPSQLWKSHSSHSQGPSSKYPHRWARGAKTDRLIILVSTLARLVPPYPYIRIDSADLVFLALFI